MKKKSFVAPSIRLEATLALITLGTVACSGQACEA